jgi:hypothetical protein
LLRHGRRSSPSRGGGRRLELESHKLEKTYPPCLPPRKRAGGDRDCRVPPSPRQKPVFYR